MADAFFNPDIAERYSLARPAIPDDVVTKILRTFTEEGRSKLNHVVDVGCGSGQFSILLSAVAGYVTAVDFSSAQIHQGIRNRNADNINYQVGSYDCLPVISESVDIITCAQSAHFFDEDVFYEEVDRCLIPGGYLALTGYATCDLVNVPDEIKDMNRHFLKEFLKPYWFAKRKLVDNSYRDMKLPYMDSHRFDTHMEKSYDIGMLTMYYRSISAYHKFKRAQPHAQDPVDTLIARILKALPGKDAFVKVRWPVFLIMSRKPFR